MKISIFQLEISLMQRWGYSRIFGLSLSLSATATRREAVTKEHRRSDLLQGLESYVATSVPRWCKPWCASEIGGLVRTASRLVSLGNVARSSFSERENYRSASVSLINEGDWRLTGCQIASVTPLPEYSRRFPADNRSPSLRIDSRRALSVSSALPWSDRSSPLSLPLSLSLSRSLLW